MPEESIQTETITEQASQVTEPGTAGQAVSTDASETGKERVVAGLPEGMTLDKLPDAYKSLQAEYTKQQQAYKDIEGKLSPYGGAEKIMAWAQYLSDNPNFQEWVKTEQQRQILGADKNSEGLDEDTKKAMDIVQRIADQRIKAAMAEKVEPIEQAMKQERLEENLARMDSDPVYSGWREYQAAMADIASELPESVQDNPSSENLKDLYWMAVRRSGKLESVMAKTYEKVLQTKKTQSQEKPTKSGGDSMPPEVKNIREAFEYAKRKHGVSTL